MRKRSSNIITLLVGLLLGTLVGMLFSPVRGSTLRSLLLYQLRKIAQKISTLFIYAIRFPKHVITNNNGKVASQDVIDRTIEKARKLLEEAKNLSEQLDK
jgi:gas vesicle protein